MMGLIKHMRIIVLENNRKQKSEKEGGKTSQVVCRSECKNYLYVQE
jgi:hypothetical protein